MELEDPFPYNPGVQRGALVEAQVDVSPSADLLRQEALRADSEIAEGGRHAADEAAPGEQVQGRALDARPGSLSRAAGVRHYVDRSGKGQVGVRGRSTFITNCSVQAFFFQYFPLPP